MGGTHKHEIAPTHNLTHVRAQNFSTTAPSPKFQDLQVWKDQQKIMFWAHGSQNSSKVHPNMGETWPTSVYEGGHQRLAKGEGLIDFWCGRRTKHGLPKQRLSILLYVLKEVCLTCVKITWDQEPWKAFHAWTLGGQELRLQNWIVYFLGKRLESLGLLLHCGWAKNVFLM